VRPLGRFFSFARSFLPGASRLPAVGVRHHAAITLGEHRLLGKAQYVQLAVDLGIPPDRIETIISFDMAAQYGTKHAGSADGSNRAVLTEMASLVATGRLEIPIAATYPLDQVRDAYAQLEQRRTHGKIVLIP
jgi:hypothetical protein